MTKLKRLLQTQQIAEMTQEEVPEIKRIFLDYPHIQFYRERVEMKELLNTFVSSPQVGVFQVHVNIQELVKETRKYIGCATLMDGTELCILYEFPLAIPSIGTLIQVITTDFRVFIRTSAAEDHESVH